MPVKATGPGTVHETVRWPGGVGWIAHPTETMERAGHALATDTGVWVVEPVDADGLDDLLGDLGAVVGIVVLLEQHLRDAESLASRHDVPIYAPSWLRIDPDTPTEAISNGLPGTDYDLLTVLANGIWREGALFDGETLYVPESVGTASYFLAPGEELGVSHMRRPWPPREALGDLDPDRLLVGHGPGIDKEAGPALRAAIEHARPSTVSFYRSNFPTYFRTLWAAIRT